MAAAGAGHRALAAATAFGGYRALGHNSKTAHDDALDGQAGFRVAGQRLVAHGLLGLEATQDVAGLLRNGLVNVGGHGRKLVKIVREVLGEVRLKVGQD